MNFSNYAKIKSLAFNVIGSFYYVEDSITERNFIIASKVKLADEVSSILFTICGLNSERKGYC